MRWTLALIGLLLWNGLALPMAAAPCRIVKVLPQLLDSKGQHTLAPSLYSRDAYQALLREHPEKCSGIRFAVQWKAHVKDSGSLKLRIQIRGSKETRNLSLEQPITRTRLFHRWTFLVLTGEAFQKTGEITAWRATLWDGDLLLAEQKSFLW